MRYYLGFVLLAVSAMLFAACPEAGTPANTENSGSGNENTAPAADPKAAVVDSETKAYEAWKARDGKFFETNLADNFVSTGNYTNKAELVKRITDLPCEIKTFKLEDPQTVNLSDDAVLVTSKVVADYTCDGKPGVSPQYAAGVWVKNGGDWKLAFHKSVDAADAKGEAKPPAKPANLANADDELTKTLSEMENKWWEEWKNKETSYFEGWARSDFINLGPEGRRDKATSLKEGKETPCEIKSYSNEGFKTTQLAENVVVLTYFATQEGMCGKDAIPGRVFSSTIFVKEGDTWKGAFYMETAAA